MSRRCMFYGQINHLLQCSYAALWVIAIVWLLDVCVERKKEAKFFGGKKKKMRATTSACVPHNFNTPALCHATRTVHFCHISSFTCLSHLPSII